MDMSRILHSPVFSQTFTVFRKSGEWQSGRFVTIEEKELRVRGVVTPAEPKDLVQVPEGDRVTSVMCFYADQPLHTTNLTGTSDEILWRGERYRVAAVLPWGDFGYWKALGVRMVSD